MKERNYNRRYTKEYGFWQSLFYKTFVKIVVTPLAKILYNFKTTGQENLDSNKRYLFAPNHVSYLDPPLVTLATGQKVAYMAKHELFTDKSWLLRTLVVSLGAFAVNRENPEIATFKTVFDLIKTDWSLGIFPEGRITTSNNLSKIQKGFISIAKKAKFEIVPVGVCGFDGYSRKPFEKNITLKIGTPISYELADDEIVKIWANQICEMTGMINELVEDNVLQYS